MATSGWLQARTAISAFTEGRFSPLAHQPSTKNHPPIEIHATFLAGNATTLAACFASTRSRTAFAAAGVMPAAPDPSLSPAIAIAQASFLKTFQPYDRTKEVNEEARKAGAALIADGVKAPRRTFIYVNNRLDGNALSTIQAMIDLATS